MNFKKIINQFEKDFKWSFVCFNNEGVTCKSNFYNYKQSRESDIAVRIFSNTEKIEIIETYKKGSSYNLETISIINFYPQKNLIRNIINDYLGI